MRLGNCEEETGEVMSEYIGSYVTCPVCGAKTDYHKLHQCRKETQAMTAKAYWPTPPDGASDAVIQAYTIWPCGLSKQRYGLTKEDMRLLNRGLRRGELRNIADPNGWGSKASSMCWGPVVTFTEGAKP
jgi:hypothetical protein